LQCKQRLHLTNLVEDIPSIYSRLWRSIFGGEPNEAAICPWCIARY